MRGSCLDCVKKHIAQASILMDESHLGYPHHKYFAVGHLAEAESESLAQHPQLAKSIREARLAIMNNEAEPNFDTLILSVCAITDEFRNVKNGSNSKKFDSLNPKEESNESNN